MNQVPVEAHDLLGSPHHAIVATIQPDGGPQMSPVWITHEDGVPSFNTARGRAKVRNLERDARCAFVVFDTQDPERYLEVRGVATIEPDDGLAHCQAIAHRYTGGPFRPLEEGEIRVKVTVFPQQVTYHDNP